MEYLNSAILEIDTSWTTHTCTGTRTCMYMYMYIKKCTKLLKYFMPLKRG